MELIKISQLSRTVSQSGNAMITFDIRGRIAINVSGIKLLKSFEVYKPDTVQYLQFFINNDEIHFIITEDKNDSLIIYSGKNRLICQSKALVYHLKDVYDWPLEMEKLKTILYNFEKANNYGFFRCF